MSGNKFSCVVFVLCCLLFFGSASALVMASDKDGSEQIKSKEHRHTFYEYHCTKEESKVASAYVMQCHDENNLTPWSCIYKGITKHCTLECYEEELK